MIQFFISVHLVRIINTLHEIFEQVGFKEFVEEYQDEPISQEFPIEFEIFDSGLTCQVFLITKWNNLIFPKITNRWQKDLIDTSSHNLSTNF